MSSVTESNKRIAKNTFFLHYILVVLCYKLWGKRILEFII